MSQPQTAGVFKGDPEKYGPEYEKHLIEQYKMYVELMDRVSARRMLANTFFVGVHTALIGAYTVMVKEGVLSKDAVGLMPFAAVLLLCFVWWRIINSYRQLNTGKFNIIHKIEQRLPLALFAEEWRILGGGKDESKYRPLSHVENWVPICFAAMYLLLALALLCRA